MMRTWAGWYAAALAAHYAHGAARPLLIVLDCKGGPDARVKAARTRTPSARRRAGRVAIWPDEATVSLWGLPPADLAVTLFQMIESGTGPAAYYADVTQAVITLAVSAPPGPPASGSGVPGPAGPRAGSKPLTPVTRPDWPPCVAARRSVADVSLRYRTLLSRLGPGLDGPGTLADADAWYFILEGTREQSVAEAQAMALTELAAHAATSPGHRTPAILLACDDYSAVSGQVPLWQLYERGRSLGIGVQVSAQSWQGLGRDEDERYRIAATADGGIWLLRTPYPQPVCELAGTRRVIETATKVIGGMWGDEGSSRVQHAWTADPGIARPLADRPGRLHPRRRLHLGPDRPAPALPAGHSPAPPAAARDHPPGPGPRAGAGRRCRLDRRVTWTTCSARRPAHDQPRTRSPSWACPPART